MVQVVPFQLSARVTPPIRLPRVPTAVQSPGALHDTPSSADPPAGVGVGWIVQVVPFHCSASA
jgi:hypothetical protein